MTQAWFPSSLHPPDYYLDNKLVYSRIRLRGGDVNLREPSLIAILWHKASSSEHKLIQLKAHWTHTRITTLPTHWQPLVQGVTKCVRKSHGSDAVIRNVVITSTHPNSQYPTHTHRLRSAVCPSDDFRISLVSALTENKLRRQIDGALAKKTSAWKNVRKNLNC